MISQCVVFILDHSRYALNLSAVDRVTRIAQVTPLPGAPKIVMGVVNIAGQVVPVIDIRQRFNLPAKEILLTDLLIFARTEQRPVALVADAVEHVIECSAQTMIPAQAVLPRLRHLEGVIKFKDGLILIHNLDTFLSLEEEESLARALET